MMLKTCAFFAVVVLVGGCVGPDRKAEFVRGMGWSPWHATYGWNRPAEVVEQDYEILHDMNVNALRTWGPMSRQGADDALEHGFRVLPQLSHPETARMTFADGKSGHPVYGAPKSHAAIAAEADRVAGELTGHAGLLAYNLGNEYSWVGQNASGDYQHLGFDDQTLGLFRQRLSERFSSIENWRAMTGREDASFADIVPPTGAVQDLLYWEWWRYQRESFGGYLKAAHDACRRVDPGTPTTYALLCGGRWDAATEDADLPFLEIQGDNLYYHWGNNWLSYAVRLARRIGPGCPIYVTETGINTWEEQDPAASDRLMRQMLWLLVLHPEVKGVFPFVYCDEWWHGPDPKAYDCNEDAWGIVTADRKPKSTYRALTETYAEFARLDGFMQDRGSPVELLVSDQVIDRWKGTHGPLVDTVCDLLYRKGISFRLVSMLHAKDLSASTCKRLLLLDSCLPDEPEGSSSARAALGNFEARGGEILCLNDAPWKALYGTATLPPVSSARVLPGDADVWEALAPWFAEIRPELQTDAECPVFWRTLHAGGRTYILVVAVGETSPPVVHISHCTAVDLASPTGASLCRTATGWDLTGMGAYALLRVKGPAGR